MCGDINNFLIENPVSTRLALYEYSSYYAMKCGRLSENANYLRLFFYDKHGNYSTVYEDTRRDTKLHI